PAPAVAGVAIGGHAAGQATSLRHARPARRPRRRAGAAPRSGPERRLHGVGPHRQRSDAHARRVEDRAGDRRRDQADGRLAVAGSTDTFATPASYVPSRSTRAMPRPVTTPCRALAPGFGDGRASHPADFAAAWRTAIARGSVRCWTRKSSESLPALAAISS